MTVSSCKFARVVIGVKVERKDVEIQPSNIFWIKIQKKINKEFIGTFNKVFALTKFLIL